MKFFFFILLCVCVTILTTAINFNSGTFTVLNSLVKSTKSVKTSKKSKVNSDLTKQNKNDKAIKTKHKKLEVVMEAPEEDVDNKSQEVIDAFTSPLETILPFVHPLFLSLAFLITWKVNLQDKNIILFTRIAFAAYMIIAQLTAMYIESRINKLNDLTPVIEAPPAANPFKAALSTAMPQFDTKTPTDPDSESSNPENTDNETVMSESSITTKDYDLRELKSFSSNLLFEGAMSTFMHFKQKSMKSLVFALLVGISNLITCNVVKIHILGKLVTFIFTIYLQYEYIYIKLHIIKFIKHIIILISYNFLY